MGLDEGGVNAGVEILIRSRTWPIRVAVARAPGSLSGINGQYLKKILASLRLKKSAEGWGLALRGRGRFYLRDPRAEDDLRRAAESGPAAAHARLWLAELEMSRAPGSAPAAIKILERISGPAPLRAWALAVRAACRFKGGETGPALEDADAAVKLDPRRPWLRTLRSEFLSEAVRYRESIADAVLAAKNLPKEPWAHLLLARAHFNCNGDRKAAAAALEHALRLDPRSAEGKVMKAEALRRTGRFGPALKVYRSVGDLGDRYPRLYAWRGSLLRQLGKNREALKDLDLACRLSPEYPLVFLERAHARLSLGSFAVAFEDMRRAARLDSKHGWAHGRPGESGEFERITRLLEQAASALPKNPWGPAWLGECLLKAGRFDEALARLDRALEIDPACAWVLTWRGETLLALGRAPEAVADLKKAAALDGGYARAVGRLGAALSLTGRPREALAKLHKAAQLDSRCAWIYGHRGEANLLLGRPAAAVADLERALQLDQGYPDAYLWRGMARKLLGDPRGDSDMRRALELRPDPAWVREWLERLRKKP